jgi:hypothetical protein
VRASRQRSDFGGEREGVAYQRERPPHGVDGAKRLTIKPLVSADQ